MSVTSGFFCLVSVLKQGRGGRADGGCGNFMYHPENIYKEGKPISHTVVKGDCLWNLAVKYLGSSYRWSEIYEMNKSVIKNPNLIYVGQVLTIPSH